MKKRPEDDDTSIGNILINMGLLTEDELEEIVAAFQRSKEELLGEFIVRATADRPNPITEEQIET